VSTAAKHTEKARFGLFEANLKTGELYRSGIRVRLQAQPFRVLTFLLENAGDVVGRDQLQQYLWGNDTVVDFEHSLGTAINKIRDALGDSAENPRFIETLAKRGYRFIAPVSFVPPPLSPLDTNSFFGESSEAAEVPRVEAQIHAVPVARRTRGAWVLLGICAVCVIALAALIFRDASRAEEPPLQISRVTSSGRVSPGDSFLENLPEIMTDGTRLYFPELENGRTRLAQSLIAGGEATSLTLPDEIIAPLPGDISPDGARLLIRNHISAETEQTLWTVPTLGGAARQIPGVLAQDATWMPDGRHILYAAGNVLWTAGENGETPQRFAILPGRPFWLRWMPGGAVLRLTLLNPDNHTTSLWELNSAGKNAHPLLPGWSTPQGECCGSWTSDGKYFVFESRHSGEKNIWMLPPRGGNPVQLTNGPLDYQAPVTSRSGDRVFFIGADPRSELLEYSPATKTFLPFGEALMTAHRVVFSRDGKWMAWISNEDSSLWRSRVNGTERVQLTGRPMETFIMQWSPDARQLLFMAREPGKRWQIYSIGADGSNLHAMLTEDRNEADPDWSPDGKQIVFGRVPALMGETAETKAIYLFDIAAGKAVELPGSQGLFSPRWSPDGRYIAALSLDMMRLMLFDMTTRTWRLLVQQSVADPVWSQDSRSLFFHTYVQKSQTIYRIGVPGGKVEHVADLEDLHFADAVDYQFAGITPRDVPLVNARMSTANIYSTQLQK
jgi:Tol biopolymer transport system component/DNA-binding winged helix-turn-helix (wHTH) protein